MKCSTPSCGGDAVIQWQKLLDDATVDEHIATIHARLVQAAEDQRLTMRVRLAALQDAIDNPPQNLSPADVIAFQERGRKQVADLQAQHDAMPTTFDLDHHRTGAAKSMFACEAHRHDDGEWYARVHAATCSGEKECGC